MGPKVKHSYSRAAKDYLAVSFPLPADGKPEDCMNGHILHMLVNLNLSVSSLAHQINVIFGFIPFSLDVYNLISKAAKWAKNFLRVSAREHFENFCNAPFKRCMLPPSTKITPSTSGTSLIAQPAGDEPPSSLQNSREAFHTPRDVITHTERQMKRRLSILSSQLANSIKKHKIQIAQEKTHFTDLPQRIKILKQSERRKIIQIKGLKQKLHKLQSQAKQLDYYKHKNKLDKGIVVKKMKISDELSDWYSTATRMLVYNMLISSVPTSSIPHLVLKAGQYTGDTLDKIQHTSTVELMARELGIISDLQCAEIAMTHSQLTLVFYAMTQECVHINCIHLSTEDKRVVIAIDQLPGATAEDYGDHICKSLDHLADIYSTFYLIDFQECRSTILNNISNTISGRNPVHHSTYERVCESWGKTLNELNFHLHPLDSIATSCRIALKSLETEPSLLYGSNCLALKIVLSINKMRFKNGKGDPKAFVNFLIENKLPRALIPRYRGNRLYYLFHTCGILVKHYELFDKFLSSWSVTCGELQASLRVDFNNPTARRELCLLAVLGKLLADPWISTFYVSPDDKLDHVGAIQRVQNVLKTIQDSKADPGELFTRPTDFFNNPIQEGQLEIFTRICPVDTELSVMALTCLNAITDVLSQQYERYFSLNISETLKKEKKTAKIHKIHSEQIMDMFNFAKSMTQNEASHFISSKLRAIKNRTVDYLETRDPSTIEEIVTWSIQAARRQRADNRLKQADMYTEICKRLNCEKQWKNEKEKRKIEKDLAKMSLDEIKSKYSELSQKQLTDLELVMSDRIVGRKLCHIWSDTVKATKETSCGRVKKMKAGKKEISYTIAYWKSDESENDSVDYTKKKMQLVADVVSGELMFS